MSCFRHQCSMGYGVWGKGCDSVSEIKRVKNTEEIQHGP